VGSFTSEQMPVAQTAALCAEMHVPGCQGTRSSSGSHLACKLACLEQVKVDDLTPLQAGSGPLDRYLRLKAMQRESYMHFFYEVRKPLTCCTTRSKQSITLKLHGADASPPMHSALLLWSVPGMPGVNDATYSQFVRSPMTTDKNQLLSETRRAAIICLYASRGSPVVALHAQTWAGA
jgi:hypothetical protein